MENVKDAVKADNIIGIGTADASAAQSDEDFVVKFKKPYTFEGRTITQIDLSGIEDLTAQQLMKADKVLVSSGTLAVTNETNNHYALIIASMVTDIPVEFFMNLKARDAVNIRRKVTYFFREEE